MTLDKSVFKHTLTELVEQSTDSVSFSASQKQTPHFIIAYSGGLDSHVLLHLIHACGFSCSAIYIDHGLQVQSTDWALHCAEVCQELGVTFKAISVDAKAEQGESPEASARGARYQALAAAMQAGDILVTAQHQQDQSETLILQLLRTAGPSGLSAMPSCKPFASGLHMRPLLTSTKQQLSEYAHQHQLKWIEDPSNADQRFDRNFLRQSIFPLLENRWPSIHQTFSNVASLQAESAELLKDLAEQDAKQAFDGEQILIPQLLALSRARQRNLIRHWLLVLGLDTPTAKRMDEITGSMLTAAADKMPIVWWQQTEVRRFQDKLYAVKAMPDFDPQIIIDCQQQALIDLPMLNTQLNFVKAESGLSADILKQNLSIRFRQGGEKIKPVGRAHTSDLKKLMQEAAIPPWQRARLPLLYLDDALIAVADYWLAEGYQNQPNQPALQLKTGFL